MAPAELKRIAPARAAEERLCDPLFFSALLGTLLGISGTVYFLFGLAGFVGSVWLNLLVAGSVIAAAIAFLLVFFQILIDANSTTRAIGAAIVAVLAAEVLLGLVPPTARDELTHHLAIPRLYARAGRVIEIPMAPYSYYPMLIDMLYTPWVYWGYDFVPKLIHCLYGFLTGFALYGYLSRRMNRVYGLIGFFFFVSIPAVLRLDHWAYVDLGTVFYGTASLLCLLRWSERSDGGSWLILAGATAGFAAATKPNGLVVVLMLVFTLVFILAGEERKSAARIAGPLLLFAIAAGPPFVPWLAKNWYQTGNPFFPLLTEWFHARGGAGAPAAPSFGGFGIWATRRLLYGESWWQIAGLPLRVFFSGRDDSPQFFDGVLSPILILFLPWAFKGKWLPEKKLLAGFALLYLAYASFLVSMRVRYILPIVPPLVVLLVYGIFNLYLRMKRPRYLVAALFFFAILNLSYLWSYFQMIRPLAYVSGHESREAYLNRMLPEYPVFAYINRELPENSKIYLLFMGRRGYYCERPYVHDGGELPVLLVGVIQSAQDPGDVAGALKRQGITHLMIRNGLLVRFLTDNLTPRERQLWNAFAAQDLEPRFSSQGYTLYRLNG